MKKKLLYLMMIGLIAPVAYGLGGSSSSGGSILGDTYNPWFLQNTRVVNYCIEQDLANFSGTAQQSREAIQGAITYWKAAFAVKNQSEYFKLATQEFREVDCANGSDIGIYFQFGTLRENFRDYLANPRAVVAYTQRTFYNSRKMLGTGFIYVAPEQGPMRPDLKEMDSHLWAFSDALRLKLVLIHELGHVFGVRHSGGNDLSRAADIMHELTPESLVNIDYDTDPVDAPLKLFLKVLASKPNLGDYNGGLEKVICSDENQPTYLAWTKFFESNQLVGCLKVKIENHFTLSVWHSSGRQTLYELLGRSRSDHPNFWETGWDQRFISIKVSNDRDVFVDLPAARIQGEYYFGFPVRGNKTVVITYASSRSAATKDIILTWEADQVEFGGSANGSINPFALMMTHLDIP